MISISIETVEPLTGSATTGNEEPVHFEGWLDLLRVLSLLVSEGGRGLSGQNLNDANRHDEIEGVEMSRSTI